MERKFITPLFVRKTTVFIALVGLILVWSCKEEEAPVCMNNIDTVALSNDVAYTNNIYKFYYLGETTTVNLKLFVGKCRDVEFLFDGVPGENIDIRDDSLFVMVPDVTGEVQVSYRDKQQEVVLGTIEILSSKGHWEEIRLLEQEQFYFINSNHNEEFFYGINKFNPTTNEYLDWNNIFRFSLADENFTQLYTNKEPIRSKLYFVDEPYLYLVHRNTLVKIDGTTGTSDTLSLPFDLKIYNHRSIQTYKHHETQYFAYDQSYDTLDLYEVVIQDFNLNTLESQNYWSFPINDQLSPERNQFKVINLSFDEEDNAFIVIEYGNYYLIFEFNFAENKHTFHGSLGAAHYLFRIGETFYFLKDDYPIRYFQAYTLSTKVPYFLESPIPKPFGKQVSTYFNAFSNQENGYILTSRGFYSEESDETTTVIYRFTPN